MVTESGDLVVLAVQRQGEELGPARSRSRPATRSCSRAPWDAIEAHAGDQRVLAVDPPELVRRQAVPLGPGAGEALVDPRPG